MLGERLQMTAIADKIIKRIRAKGRGKWVCCPRDFLDLGSRAAVDQALTRLVKAGMLRRVGRGLYDLPRMSPRLKGPAPVDIDLAVAAMARRDNARIMPDGIVAANRLGLTNAVPAKAAYVTDGASRTLKIDGRTVRMRHAGPDIMGWTGRPAAPVVQALDWLGPQAADDDRVVTMLKRRLNDRVKKDLAKGLRALPSWTIPLVKQVVGVQSSAA
jgi:hypothetical protein